MLITFKGNRSQEIVINILDPAFSDYMETFLLEQKKKQPDFKLLVACSGGVDSMVLACVLTHTCQKIDAKYPILLHVNYGLRGEDSDADQALVEEFAASHGLKAFCLDTKKQSFTQSVGNFQAWARQLRYDWFQTHASEHDVIALAHHQDDVAENMLMRMARGSGPDVGGMRLWKKPFWRPFVSSSKEDIREFADRQKVPFREDLSNASLKYDRNIVRHKILPLLESMYPGAAQRMAALAADLADHSDFLDAEFCEFLHAKYLHRSRIKSLPVGVALSVIASFLKVKLGNELRLNRSQLLRAYESLSQGKSWVEDLPGKGRIDVCSHKGLSVRFKSEAMHPRAAQYRAMLNHPGDEVLLETGARLIP